LAVILRKRACLTVQQYNYYTEETGGLKRKYGGDLMATTETRTTATAKKKKKYTYYYCPKCGTCFGDRKIGAFKYCYHCGRQLDWK
jgi:hypothetical protein